MGTITRTPEEIAALDINVDAIVALRDAALGMAQANWLIKGAERAAASANRGDSDGERIARLAFEVGMLQADLRKVCLLLAEVVKPVNVDRRSHDERVTDHRDADRELQSDCAHLESAHG